MVALPSSLSSSVGWLHLPPRSRQYRLLTSRKASASASVILEFCRAPASAGATYTHPPAPLIISADIPCGQESFSHKVTLLFLLLLFARPHGRFETRLHRWLSPSSPLCVGESWAISSCHCRRFVPLQPSQRRQTPPRLPQSHSRAICLAWAQQYLSRLDRLLLISSDG